MLGAKKVVEILIRYGANVNVKDLQGYSPLHVAAGKGRDKITEILIRNAALVNEKTIHGSTPLLLAAENCKWKINFVKILERTRSFLFSFPAHDKVVEILVRNFADVHVKDSDGFTPLHYAILNGSFIDIIRFLHFFINNYTVLSLSLGRIEAIENLIRNGANPNEKTNGGLTTLHLAALNGWYPNQNYIPI